MDKKQVYIGYGAWLFFVVSSFLFPQNTTSYKSGLAFFAHIAYSPAMMLFFCATTGPVLFYRGFSHNEVNKMATFLFALSVLAALVYILATSGWF